MTYVVVVFWTLGTLSSWLANHIRDAVAEICLREEKEDRLM